MRTVARVSADQRARALGTIVSAFIADPVERWLYPDPLQYLTDFPRLVTAFGGEAFTRRTVYSLADFAAVAMWISPHAQVDGEEIIAVLTQTVAHEQHDDVLAVLEQMDQAHPSEPHWYLPWLGVDCARQGGGLGGELLDHCLTFVDSEGLPAFLETPNPRTVPFYERHGFEVVGVAQAGGCPPVTSMLRPVR